MCNYSLFLDTATALGTIGATLVALWLGLRENRRRIDGTFIWDVATSYQPTLLVQNTSTRIVVIEHIELKYKRESVCSINVLEEYSFAKYAIIEAGQIQKIPMTEISLKFPKPADHGKKYKLEVIIKQLNGRKSLSTTKYSYNEIQERFFGQGLFAKD